MMTVHLMTFDRKSIERASNARRIEVKSEVES